MATDETRKDLRAAVAARQELGAEYESEIIDGFLEKLDARTAAHYGQAGYQPAPGYPQVPGYPQAAGYPVAPQPAGPPQPRKSDGDGGGLALAICSVVAGIPITAIAAETQGTFAIMISWGGLVGVNLARAISRNRNR